LEAHHIKSIGKIGLFEPLDRRFKSGTERGIIDYKGNRRGNLMFSSRPQNHPFTHRDRSFPLNLSDLSDVVADPSTVMAGFSGDETAPFFGFLGAAAALVFSCNPLSSFPQSLPLDPCLAFHYLYNLIMNLTFNPIFCSNAQNLYCFPNYYIPLGVEGHSC